MLGRRQANAHYTPSMFGGGDSAGQASAFGRCRRGGAATQIAECAQCDTNSSIQMYTHTHTHCAKQNLHTYCRHQENRAQNHTQLYSENNTPCTPYTCDGEAPIPRRRRGVGFYRTRSDRKQNINWCFSLYTPRAYCKYMMCILYILVYIYIPSNIMFSMKLYATSDTNWLSISFGPNIASEIHENIVGNL